MKSDLRISFQTVQQYRQEVTKLYSATQMAHKYVKQNCISVQLSEPRTQMHLHHYSLPCLAGDPDARMQECVNPLNPICYLLALLGAHHFLHVSRIRVKSLTLR